MQPLFTLAITMILLFIISVFTSGITSVTSKETKLWRDDCRCGRNNTLPGGSSPGECNPKSSKPCCSDDMDGWCGDTDLHCYCFGCIDYRDPAVEDLDLVKFTQSEAIKICFESQDSGTCQERHRRWSYNTTALKCHIFYWSGCHGNRNNFNTRYECEHTCFNIEAYRNVSMGLVDGNGTESKNITTIHSKCAQRRCRPHAICNKATGECVCMEGYTGDPMSFVGCQRILREMNVIMELRQCPSSGRVNRIIEGPFCADLFSTRQKEPCNNNNADVGYTAGSTTIQYMECKDVSKVGGRCMVVEEFTGPDGLTTVIKLKITVEEGLIRTPMMQYIREQLTLLPGIFDPSANSLIWLNRANTSQFIAMKWDSIVIEGGNVTQHIVPTSKPITIKETFASDMCEDLVVDGICNDLMREGNNLYCHAHTGDDLCRKSCMGCEAYGGNETCFNTVDFCRELHKMDACNTHKKDMKILCPYTCDFCDEKADLYAPEGICGDLNNNCALIRDTYGCGNKYVTYHKQHLQCQKTCGLCNPPTGDPADNMIDSQRKRKK